MLQFSNGHVAIDSIVAIIDAPFDYNNVAQLSLRPTSRVTRVSNPGRLPKQQRPKG